jgi:flagellar hook assembly protein FlgD
MHEDAGMMGQFVVVPRAKNIASNTAVESPATSVSGKAELSVYPNPFLTSTNISYILSRSERISLDIFDVNGRLVKAFTSVPADAGSHRLTWNARDNNGNAVHAGIYLLKLQTGNYSQTTKIVLMK